MTTDLRGWQQAHLPTPPAPPRPAPRRWPLFLAVFAAGGVGTAAWCFRADLAALTHRAHASAVQATTAAQAEGDQHLSARAAAMEHLFDVTVDPHGGDASVISAPEAPAPPAAVLAPAQPVAVLAPARSGAAPSADQVAAARRGMSTADNELAKSRRVIARDQAAITAAHQPIVGAWARLNALYAQARNDQDRYTVSVSMHNLQAQEENAQREIAENQHLVETWTQRRAQFAVTAGAAP